MTTISSRRRTRVSDIIQPIVVLAMMAVLLGIPLWVMVVTAGKSVAAARNPNISLPEHWELWKNFGTALGEGAMPPALLGSAILLIPTVFGVLIFGAMASWILARRKGRVISIIYSVGISGVLVSPTVVTVVLVLRVIGLDGSAVGMIGVYMGIYMSTVIFFVTGFIRTIPIELEEAARIDGAGVIQVFFKIIMPLLGPALGTATILVSLLVWNDVYFALFVIGGKMDVLTLNLYKVASASEYLKNWNVIFAYIILMTIPMLLVFIVAQRRIISGVTSGAVK